MEACLANKMMLFPLLSPNDWVFLISHSMGPTPPGQALAPGLAPGLAVNLQKLRINYSARMGVEGLEHLMQLGNGWGKVEADPPEGWQLRSWETSSYYGRDGRYCFYPWDSVLIGPGICIDMR